MAYFMCIWNLQKNDCVVTKLTALHLHMKQPDQKKMDVSS